MDSFTASCGEELGVAGRQSAKRTPQSRNAPGPNNVLPPNTLGRSVSPVTGGLKIRARSPAVSKRKQDQSLELFQLDAMPAQGIADL
ncbi:hypothetical protein, partial [Microvirga vignae]|uniref:hypothetical protein n=1 Tax=Microvirga vignae TaxID=1225564 RepID=UPI001AEC01A4